MRAALGCVLLTAVLLGPDAGAQTLDRGVLGNGGRAASGGGMTVVGTVGQAAVSQSAGAGNVVCHGWWCVERGTLVAVPDTTSVEGVVTGWERPRPNPARGAVVLALRLANEGRVEMAVYDAAGSRVATLLDGVQPAGRHEARWDGTSLRGDRCAAGVYFVTFSVDGSRAGRQRIVLLR